MDLIICLSTYSGYIFNICCSSTEERRKDKLNIVRFGCFVM